MKRSLDSSNIREALKCAAAMTSELRTSKLFPKNYYELCKQKKLKNIHYTNTESKQKLVY